MNCYIFKCITCIKASVNVASHTSCNEYGRSSQDIVLQFESVLLICKVKWDKQSCWVETYDILTWKYVMDWDRHQRMCCCITFYYVSVSWFGIFVCHTLYFKSRDLHLGPNDKIVRLNTCTNWVPTCFGMPNWFHTGPRLHTDGNSVMDMDGPKIFQ